MGDAYIKPCFDSSVFIGGLEDEICKGVKRGVVFRWLIEQVKAGKFKVLISAIALAEVYKKKRFATPGDPQLDEFLELAEETYVEIIEVDREIGIEAHKLCREYADCGLLPSDAIHLACALRAGCDVLLTWDRPLASVAHKRIRIEPPRILERGLFTENELAEQSEIDAYNALVQADLAMRVASVPNLGPKCGGDPLTDLKKLEARESAKALIATQGGPTNGRQKEQQTADASAVDLQRGDSESTEDQTRAEAAKLKAESTNGKDNAGKGKPEEIEVTGEQPEDHPQSDSKPPSAPTPRPARTGTSGPGEADAKTSTQPPPSS